MRVKVLSCTRKWLRAKEYEGINGSFKHGNRGALYGSLLGQVMFNIGTAKKLLKMNILEYFFQNF